MHNLPPIPPIEGELLLEVYTHESLNTEPGAVTTAVHGGSARLATLGERALEFAVMANLLRRQPMFSAWQLKVNHFSTAAVVSGLSEVWRVGNVRRLCLPNQRRSMGDRLQP